MDKKLRPLMISIHAPRKGCDLDRGDLGHGAEGISIHAPRKGCDGLASRRDKQKTDFNPRTPQGVRQFLRDKGSFGDGFQSTHPARGATATTRARRRRRRISIHAPRKGCDAVPRGLRGKTGDFNPRTPQGVRLIAGDELAREIDFNPRTPQGVRHSPPRAASCSPAFQSTHPARGATFERGVRRARRAISIHAPRKGCDGNNAHSFCAFLR